MFHADVPGFCVPALYKHMSVGPHTGTICHTRIMCYRQDQPWKSCNQEDIHWAGWSCWPCFAYQIQHYATSDLVLLIPLCFTLPFKLVGQVCIRIDSFYCVITCWSHSAYLNILVATNWLQVIASRLLPYPFHLGGRPSFSIHCRLDGYDFFELGSGWFCSRLLKETSTKQ